MEKNFNMRGVPYRNLLQKLLLTMRLILFILTTTTLSLFATGSYSQNARVSIDMKNSSLRDVLSAIEKSSEFFFIYNNELIDVDRKVDLNVKDQKIGDILKKLFNSDEVEIAVIDRKIILAPAYMKAQDQKITGTVTDATTGEAIVGANIIVEGTTTGTVSDVDGKFSIDVPKGSVLLVSFLGFNTERIVIDGQTNLEIKLIPDIKSLEEVVVVGYGVQKKVNLTGAVSTISTNDINKRQVNQSSMALQGLAPGVTVQQKTGQPGVDDGTIRIRGVGTIGDANPLVLVDGVQMSINSIDVGAIESMSVLKDAASASIYGSRAANGVILITTKRGKEDKFQVSYNSYFGWQSPTYLPKKLNAVDHMTLLNEAYTNTGRTPLYAQDYIDQYNENHTLNPDLYPDVDWQKEILQGDGFQQNHFISFTGGSKRLKVYSALGIVDQNGLIKNADFNRYSLRLNTDLMVTKKLNASFDLFISDDKRTSAPLFSDITNGAGTNLIFGMMNKLPAVQAVRFQNGKWGEGQNGQNPVAMIEEGGYYREWSMPVTANFGLKYNVFDFLTAKFAYSPSFFSNRVKSFVNSITTYKPDATSVFGIFPSKNFADNIYSNSRQDHVEATLNFDKTFGDHGITILAGYQFESFHRDELTAFRDDFQFPAYSELVAGSSSNMQNNGTASEWALLSYFGRLNYMLKSKYLLEANLRYDGSSRFAKGQKWGVFPSFSLGWKLMEENFMEPLKPYFDNIKLRASWGRLGNQNIGGNYPFVSTVDMRTNYISGGLLQSGASITSYANTDITWESTEMTDVGIDLTIFKNLLITFDYYYKRTSDILLQLDIPKSMGLSNPFQNAGVVDNRGWDLQVDYNNNLGKLRYGITATLSDVLNEVIDLKGLSQTGVLANREGYPMNSFYLYEAIGLMSEDDFDGTGKYLGPTQSGNLKPGDIKYKDSEPDNIINGKDKKVLGSSIPRYTYSFNLNLEYGIFDFGALIQGIGKVDNYLSSNAVQPFLLGGTAYEFHKDRYTNENKNLNAKNPRFAFGETNNQLESSFWLKSAAYMRIKNIQVGVSLPKNLLEKSKIARARVYASAENMFTFTKFWEGWDPEIAPNSNGKYYPQVKTLNLGLNLTF